MRNKHHTAAEPKIPITRVAIDAREEELVLQVLRSGWLAQGKQVAEFEHRFAEWLGVRHAIATTSCTTALHLALIAAGVEHRDEVILPSFTFIATANAIEYIGARPVFVDIDPATFTIDLNQLESCLRDRIALGKRVKAIIPVSLFGLCVPMPEINQLAEKYNAVVIEDAACGLGGTRKEHKAGTEATISCFSFHPRKVITTGEGGMIVINDNAIAEHLRRLRDHGALRKGHLNDQPFLMPEFPEVGYNYRMTDLQGAVGVAQMEKLDEILLHRKEKAERYNQLLAGHPAFALPKEPRGYSHGWQSYVCTFTGGYELADLANDKRLIDQFAKLRTRLMGELESLGISTRQGTHAVHMLSYYHDKYGYQPFDLPNCYLADKLSLALPLYHSLTNAEQEYVVESINNVLEQLVDEQLLDSALLPTVK